MDSNQNRELQYGYFHKLNKYIAQHILSYLNLKEILLIQSTSRALSELIPLKKVEVNRNEEQTCQDNGIMVYLTLDLPQQVQVFEGIFVQIETKDQGWASASYSSSWVTLELFKQGTIQQHQGKGDFSDQTLYENYRVQQYKTVKKAIYPSELKNENQKFIDLLNTKEYDRISILMKCQYPGWVCKMKSAKMILYFI